jgi:hypothetical protein
MLIRHVTRSVSFLLCGFTSMRLIAQPVAFLFCVASLSLFVCGCGDGGGGDMTPEGPELGAVEQYLQDHPEAREDAEVVSEDDEFSAAEDE